MRVPRAVLDANAVCAKAWVALGRRVVAVRVPPAAALASALVAVGARWVLAVVVVLAGKLRRDWPGRAAALARSVGGLVALARLALAVVLAAANTLGGAHWVLRVVLALHRRGAPPLAHTLSASRGVAPSRGPKAVVVAVGAAADACLRVARGAKRVLAVRVVEAACTLAGALGPVGRVASEACRAVAVPVRAAALARAKDVAHWAKRVLALAVAGAPGAAGASGALR